MFEFNLYKKGMEIDEDLLIEPDLEEFEYRSKRKRRKENRRLTKRELRALYSYIG